MRVEPEAIFLPACEGERGCQDSKDVGINSNFHADRSIAEIPAESVVLYYGEYCPHSKKVLRYLEKENITIPLNDVTKDPNAKNLLVAIGGYAIVPCLIVDGKPIYEDDAIIQWISEHKNSLKQ